MAAEFGGQVVGSGVEGVAVSVEFYLCSQLMPSSQQSRASKLCFYFIYFFLYERTLPVLAPVVESPEAESARWLSASMSQCKWTDGPADGVRVRVQPSWKRQI